MHAPDCPNHRRLVLDLALGRLDDRAAVEAEAVRATCPACAAWWRSELGGAAAAAVDQAVAAAFMAFQPPATSKVARWLPVAAAAALAAGAGLLWYQHGAVRPGSPTSAGPLVHESFDGDRNGDGVVGLDDIGYKVVVEQPREAIFADTLDGGDLAGWTPHT